MYDKMDTSFLGKALLVILLLFLIAFVVTAGFGTTKETKSPLDRVDINYAELELNDSTRIRFATLINLEMPEGDTITLMIQVDPLGDCEKAELWSNRTGRPENTWCEFFSEMQRIIEECKK